MWLFAGEDGGKAIIMMELISHIPMPVIIAVTKIQIMQHDYQYEPYYALN